MDEDAERKKLDAMTARILKAEGRAGQESGKTGGVISETAKMSRAGYEFVGTILICTLVGWLLDKGLNTKPWGILGMLIIGFAGALANVWRALKGYDQSVGLHKKDGE